jgi:hypothetical protein
MNILLVGTALIIPQEKKIGNNEGKTKKHKQAVSKGMMQEFKSSSSCSSVLTVTVLGHKNSIR